MTAIDVDISCSVCGYNLRGLSPDGLCPECGASVDRSLRGDLLRFADSTWLRRVSLGLTICSRSTTAMLLVLIVSVVLLLAAFLTDHVSGIAIADAILLLWAIPCILMLAIWPVLMMIGFWMFTTPEPRGGTESLFRPMAERWSSMFVMPAFGLWFAAAGQRGWQPFVPEATFAIEIACIVIIVAQTILMFGRLRKLDERCVFMSESLDERKTRDAKVKRTRSRIVGMMIVLGLVCALPQLQDPDVSPLLFLYGIIWLIALGTIDQTRSRVDIEHMASGYRT